MYVHIPGAPIIGRARCVGISSISSMMWKDFLLFGKLFCRLCLKS